MNVNSGIATKRTPAIAATLTILIVVVMVVWTPHTSVAQTDHSMAAQNVTPLTCAQLIPAVKNNLLKGCNALARDQVCFGNPGISVERQEGSTDLAGFNQPGGTASVQAVK